MERKTCWPGPPFWLQDGTPVAGAAWLLPGSIVLAWKYLVAGVRGGGGVEWEEPEFKIQTLLLTSCTHLG